jgi:glyoxylase-like metal-dependent hydrolase (beta-lactamase superfamily II)
MSLEDHVGDIVRKARAMSNVSADAVARAAGLTPVQLADLEATGTAPAKTQWAALAQAVGLHPAKLEALAAGWLPSGKDLSTWREFRVITTDQGMAVNAYLAWDEVSREAALFDTGWDATPAFGLIRENGLQLRHVFITHTHEDHIAALETVRQEFPKVRLHSSSKSAPVDQRNRPNDFIHLGSLRITNRETPGHAEDGVIYVISGWPEDAPPVAIIGDTIFAGSLASGFQSTEMLKQNVREKIFSLPPDTLLCPGHGPVTTVREEREHNPFF